MPVPPKSVHMILEIKKLSSEPYYLGQVTGMHWEHWIAANAEGQCASLIGDYMGNWLMNPKNGQLVIKKEILGEAFESFSRNRLVELELFKQPKEGSVFIHLSLFSMDDFQTGYSIAIEGRFYLGEPDTGPFTDDEN